MKKALELLWKDIKNMKLAIVVIAAYLWLNRTFLGSVCPWVVLTGFPCPGCGLTRAGMALLRGDFVEAFEIHPFIYGVAALAFAFFSYRYLLQRSQKVLVKWTAALIVGMVIFYVWRMIAVFPGEPPMSYYRYNLMRIFLDKI